MRVDGRGGRAGRSQALLGHLIDVVSISGVLLAGSGDRDPLDPGLRASGCPRFDTEQDLVTRRDGTIEAPLSLQGVGLPVDNRHGERELLRRSHHGAEVAGTEDRGAYRAAASLSGITGTCTFDSMRGRHGGTRAATARIQTCP